MSRRALAMATVAVLAAPGAAAAHGPAANHAQVAPNAVVAAAPAACPGDPIAPTRVITGEFDASLQGGFVMVPFDVPSGTTAVRVKYCYDRPELASAAGNHTLDLGLWQARPSGGFWGPPQFRGWGGSSHPDVTVSPEGFSTEAQYRERPRGHVPGKTTRGFRPGPIPAGEWAVELGVAAVVPQAEGDADGKVGWRLELELSTDPAHADEPYRPAPYDARPAQAKAGWYAGDFHVHAEHSALGDATMTETFDYAFRPLAQGGAGLDFVTLSDYVGGSAWDEIGRYQPRHPGKLIVRSSEIITYRGHANNHASVTYVDQRTGPVYERRPDGALELRRGPTPASALFDAIHSRAGFSQINHPTIFPSNVPGFARLCRGCPWDYSSAETDYSKVDAIEIATGPPGIRTGTNPGPNPFTVTAIRFWEDALATGHNIAAVGSSDSHNAGRTPGGVTQAPIGTATTVVYADELSEKGIQRGVQAGHTYVKIFGNAGPDLRFEAAVPGSPGPPAIMGDSLSGERAEFRARVLGGGPAADPSTPEPLQLVVIKDGSPFRTATVTSDDFTFPFSSAGRGRYRLQLQRGSAIEAVSSPIYLGVGRPNPRTGAGPGERPPAGAPRRPLKVAGLAPRSIRVTNGRFRVGCRASGTGVRACEVEARIERRGRSPQRLGAGRVRMSGGTATVTVALNAAGRRALARRARGIDVTLVFTALGSGRETARDRKASRLYQVRRAGRAREPRFTG